MSGTTLHTGSPKPPFRTMNLFLNTFAVLAIALILNNAHAQPPGPEAQWRVAVVNSIGERPWPCSTDTCKKIHQTFADKLVKVCMSRDASSAGLFTRGNWKVVINPADKSLCQEVLFANQADKIFYLEAPVMQSTGMFMAGQQYIHCSPEAERGEESNLCSAARASYCKNPALEAKSSGYNACASEFFTPYMANPRYKSLQLSIVGDAVRDSNMLALLEQYAADVAQRKAEEELIVYRTAYENAATLADMQAFETRYANNDPEGLIAQLAERKRTLQVQKYRQRFDAMRSERDIESFMADYAYDDPDGKLPQARRLLADARNRAALDAKRAAEQKAEEERVKKLEDLERNIIWCKRNTLAARTIIERENKIGNVSGYVNKIALRNAGEVIVRCEESIPKDYAEYRKLGGQRALANLR